MVNSEIYEEIKQLIVERIGVDASKITPETTFKDDLGADSLDIVELVMELEDRFEVEVSDDAADNMTTVGKVAAFIEKNK